MKLFESTNELILSLDRDKRLIKELFEKRKNPIRNDEALDLADDNDQRLDYLLERGVIRRESDYVELEEEYVVFFEKVLAANEVISVGLVKEYLDQLNENIEYYKIAKAEKDKHSYYYAIKRSLSKIHQATERNVIDLQRNVNTTYKVEIDYNIKLAKLKHLDKKREDIATLITKCEYIFSDSQEVFFSRDADESLRDLVYYVRNRIGEAYHHLIDLQKQIISYLHHIQESNRLYDKVRKLKYLKDQFLLSSHSNIDPLLEKNQAVWFEPQPHYSIKLSIEEMQTSDEILPIIQKISSLRQRKNDLKQQQAEAIPSDFLDLQSREYYETNLDELFMSFSTAGFDLFEFISQYKPLADKSFDEHIDAFCQVVSLNLDQLRFTGAYQTSNGIEYPIIYHQ